MTENEHLLCCLAEEAAEIIQAVSKALRFGLDDDYRGGDLAIPRQYIVNELADLVGVVELLNERGVLPPVVREAVDKKKDKVIGFISYARNKGTIV